MEDEMKTVVIGFDVDYASLDELNEINNEEGNAGLYSEWCETDCEHYYDNVFAFFTALNADNVDTENVYWFVIDAPADIL